MKKVYQLGFTVAEMTIAVSVSMVLIMAVIIFMADNLASSSVTTARATLLNEAETTLDTLGNDVRLSANADQNNRWPDNYAPNAPSDLYSWQSNASTLVLATAAQDSSGNILFLDPHKYITQKNNLIYFLQNGVLYKRILAAPVSGNAALNSCPAGHTSSTCPADRVLVHNVTAFSVKYVDGQNNQVAPTDARSIELTLSLSTKQFGRTISANYTTRTVFRND